MSGEVFQPRRRIHLPGSAAETWVIGNRAGPNKDAVFNSKAGYHLFWSWICIFYAMLMIGIALGFPAVYGITLTIKEEILDAYLAFYSYLFGMSVFCLTTKYVLTKHTQRMLRDTWKSLQHGAKTVRKSLKNSCSVASSDSEHGENKSDEQQEKPMGRFGLQVGVKVTTVVVVIMVLLDISEFLHLKSLGELCQPNVKGTVSFFQLFFIIGLSHYCMNNHKIKLHRYPVFAHFCLAHLLATTVSTGLLFVSYDTVSKLKFWRTTENSNDDDNDKTPSRNLSEISLKIFLSEVIDEESTSCELKTYIRDLSRHIGPYTYTFSMFYVYICSVILLHLILHYRGMPQKNLHTSSTNFWQLFRRQKKTSQFQSSIYGVASISLIIGALVVSILSLGGEDNIFIHIYLLILHSQANIVCLVVLRRISLLPIDPKKNPAADYLILLFFFFGVVLYNIAKHVTSVFDREGISPLEVATSIVEVVQTLEQTVLILVGLKVAHNAGQYANFQPPTELLLHLTAGNISTLITSVFLTRMELFNVNEYLENSEEHLFDVGVAWSVLGSILLPWQAFYRYYSIICLAEVNKIAQ